MMRPTRARVASTSPEMMRPPKALAAPRHFGRVVALLVVLVAVFQLATLRGDVSAWYGDSYQLVLHAQNLLGGQPYAATGYIQNPERYLAPVAYPPGFPLLMVPALALFGTDALAIEALLALLLAGTAWGLAYLVRPALPALWVYGLVLIVGLHPYLWELKQQPLSDLPFLLAVALCLLCYDRAVRAEQARRAVGLAALAGAFLWFALLTRVLGVVLLPSLLLPDLVRLRWPSRVSLVAVAVALVLYGAYALLFDADAGARLAASVGVGHGGYAALVQQDVLRHLEQLPGRAVQRVLDYARASFVFWHVPLPGGSLAKNALMLVSLVPAGAGLMYRVRHRFSAVEAFCLLYALSLLPWTFAHPRYLVPLLPFFYLYLFVGLTRFGPAAERWARTAAIAAFVAVALVSAVRYGALFSREQPRGVQADNAAYVFLRDRTPPSTVVATSGDPRPSLFFTHRASSSVPRDAGVWPAYTERIGADYVLIDARQAAERRAAEQAAYLRPILSDGPLTLYRIQPEAATERGPDDLP